MKGRKKIPNELKALRGTYYPCRMEKSAPNATTTSVIVLPKSAQRVIGFIEKLENINGKGQVHRRRSEIGRGVSRHLCHTVIVNSQHSGLLRTLTFARFFYRLESSISNGSLNDPNHKKGGGQIVEWENDELNYNPHH